MEGRNRGATGFAVALVAALVAHPASGQSDPVAFVRAAAAASRDEMAALADGAPLVRTLDTDDPRELAQAYVVRVRAPVSFVLARIREGHVLLDDAAGDGARGVFGARPDPADLAGLSLPRAEVRDLERCRPGRCDVKLPAGETSRLHEAVDWDGDASGPEADRFVRGLLLRALDAYRRGDGAALTYEDKAEPLAVLAGLRRLLDEAEDLRALDPAFHAHLYGPPESVPGIEDLYTWTVEELGAKSLVSLHHIAVRERGPSGMALIGIKRFYASHYFQASLRTLALAPAAGDPEAPDTYVTVVARYRFDGELGGIKRMAAERRLERNAGIELARFRERTEVAYAR